MNSSAINLVAFLKERIADESAPVPAEGFVASPLFQMVLRGEAKLPLDRVKEVAGAMSVDVQPLFRLAMRQFYDEESISLFEQMLGTTMTHEEQKWLDAIRSAADGHVAEPSETARRLLGVLAKSSVQK